MKMIQQQKTIVPTNPDVIAQEESTRASVKNSINGSLSGTLELNAVDDSATGVKEVASVENNGTMEMLTALEHKLFQPANFTLSDGWKEQLKIAGYQKGKEYDIHNGNFYCRDQKLLEFILGGREVAKNRTIDRYNWAILKSGDTTNSLLTYDCTDAELEAAFINNKILQQWIPSTVVWEKLEGIDRPVDRVCPVKQQLDDINYPVGAVDYYSGKPKRMGFSYVPLWYPKRGAILMVESNMERGWRLHLSTDCVGSAYPLSFPFDYSGN